MTRLRSQRPLSFQPLEDRRLLAVTGLEQETIYVLNRARHDPAAYQTEQQLPVNLSTVTPRGPLAVNQSLINSSGAKSMEMVFNNYFSHEGLNDVFPNKLVRDNGYPLPATLLDGGNGVEAIAAGTSFTTSHAPLNFLIIDAGLSTPVHRIQLFGQDAFWAANREIGIGFDNAESADFEYYWTIHTANRDTTTNFLTGVVFDDANDDRRYNDGEGLSGVTITVGALQTTTNAAGGWSIAVESGRHNIVASGGGFSGVGTATATVTDDNVAVDFISGNVDSDVSFEQHFAQSVVDSTDIDGNNELTSLDALLIINFLTRQNAGVTTAYSKPVYLDATGDGQVSSSDAFKVINALNRAAQSGTPSGEAVSNLSTAEPFDFDLASQSVADSRAYVRTQDPNDGEADLPEPNLARPRLSHRSHSAPSPSAGGRSIDHSASELLPSDRDDTDSASQGDDDTVLAIDQIHRDLLA